MLNPGKHSNVVATAGLLFFLLFSSMSQASTSNIPCEAHLTTKTIQLRLLRRELLDAQETYIQTSGRRSARFSNFVSNRAIDFDSTASEGSHIVSLGSGPDIFLPLYEFPTAKHFHLVDLLGGWGKGPEEVVEELVARIEALGPGAKLTVLNPDLLEDKGTTATWAVQWVSPSLGIQTRYISLHQIDFRDEDKLNSLAATIASNRENGTIGGLVQTGISSPLSTLEFFLDRMIRGGVFFTEMLYTNREGEVSDPESTEILYHLSQRYEIAEYPAAMNFLYTPRRYVIRKP